ncbi:uncharacterized protein LOC107620691 [Arachis ipaensis]|uniref:uncharacterized protein LOC107620691 n=1 Tax=Arachis ipaensis TaxID=130454 RepID=UPI0007AEFFFF|nr:uncharacterized protein LOC107620691 [Arachis ipaensis]
MERFEHRVMRCLDRLDQAAASQGIELPPLPESSASDEQDQEEEHGAEPTQQEAPPMTQTTTEVQQPPEVQHDIPEPQPVPPPVPQPEPEHEPQPEMIKNNESMKAFKRARKASTAENISAKAAGEGSSQVQSKPAVPSSPRARKIGPYGTIPTDDVSLQHKDGTYGSCYVAKLEKELEGEKASSVALVASVRLAKDTALRHKHSYVTSYREVMRLREELESARGKIVPDNLDDDDVEPLPVPVAKATVVPTSSAPPAGVSHPEPEPDCQILNRDDRTVDAVPFQTRPPSPHVDAASGKPLDPL